VYLTQLGADVEASVVTVCTESPLEVLYSLAGEGCERAGGPDGAGEQSIGPLMTAQQVLLPWNTPTRTLTFIGLNLVLKAELSGPHYMG
jgi:hypothetical protein